MTASDSERFAVTPLAGVWIETKASTAKLSAELVTPLAGVWIETDSHNAGRRIDPVTPLAGVWIETQGIQERQKVVCGHSPCGSVD